MTDFHDWYDDNLQRLIKGNLHDALSESWQAAQKAEREKHKDLLDALELMVSTHEDGGWPTATIVVAKAAIAKVRGNDDLQSQ